MKTHHQHPKLKSTPRPLFSCAFFRHCTQTVLSPTATESPPPLTTTTTTTTLPPPPLLPPPSSVSSIPQLPPPPPPPPPPPSNTIINTNHPPTKPSSSSSSSSSSTSQSFTQWKFPLPNSPIHPHQPSEPQIHHAPPQQHPTAPHAPPLSPDELEKIFRFAELKLSSGSEPEILAGLYRLEKSLVPNPPHEPACPPELMCALVKCMRQRVGAKSATKVLFALCLEEHNRRVAVEVGASGAVVECVMELEGPAAERALAALELMCTVPEGAEEVRTHALAVPVMVTMMGKMEGRGREHAISVLTVIYSGGNVEVIGVAPPEEVARAVMLALQGECSARGRRKGAQLLKSLEEIGRVDLTEEGV